jgi:hypothetical protein
MFESDKRSSLERLKKGLYSRRDPFGEAPRHDVHLQATEVADSWDSEEKPEVVAEPPKFRKVYKIVFLASTIFFAVALAVGLSVFYGGSNLVSVDNVNILVEGPASIAGGEPLSLTVAVTNTNATPIELVDLIAEYPNGAKNPENVSEDLSRVRISLGTIESQSSVQRTLSSLMFGEEGALRDIKFTAEYRTADSNAIFYKEKTYHVTISSSPVLVSVDALDKVLSGQSSEISVTVSSNTTAPVKDLLLSLDYPFGMAVSTASPQPTFGNNIWRIGDLAPGAKRTFKITATLSGEDGEDRSVRANVGIRSQTNEREIATTIIARTHTFTLEKPFLGLDLVFDGIHGDLSAVPGRSIRTELIWTNNSASKITNAKIVAKLSGTALDKNSVVSTDGYYDSSANTITWQAGRTSSLDTIAPGDSDRVSFSFRSITASPGESLLNPVITVSVSAEGSRTDDTGAPANITAAATQSVKLVSNLALAARLLRTQGPIVNSGPVPPRVDQETTYTVLWTITNTSNVITGAKVEATLPPYVKWTGAFTPTDSNITYDPASGNVTWLAGDISQNANIGTGAKQVAFQVSLMPSANQIGSAPMVVGSATLTGTDVFTGASLQNTASLLSTRTATDLLFKAGDEIVQQ